MSNDITTELEIFLQDYKSFMKDTRAYSSPNWQTPSGPTFLKCVERVWEYNESLGWKQLNGAGNRIKTGTKLALERADIQAARHERRYLEQDTRGLGYNLSIVDKNQNQLYWRLNRNGEKCLSVLGKKLLKIHGEHGCRARGKFLFDKDKKENKKISNYNIPSKADKPAKPKTLAEALKRVNKRINKIK